MDRRGSEDREELDTIMKVAVGTVWTLAVTVTWQVMGWIALVHVVNSCEVLIVPVVEGMGMWEMVTEDGE